jgi:DNA-binding response OmpR family regulator
LLDELLPDVNSSGIVDALREVTSMKSLPILFIERSAPQVIAELHELDAVRVIRVPFTPAEFVELLEQAVLSEKAWAENSRPTDTKLATQQGGILLVSSDYDFLEWIETSLRRHKFSCTVANDLFRAQEIARETAPDAILVDADTFANVADATRALGRDSAADIPLFIATAHPHATHDLDAAAIVLHKPFGIESLIQAIPALQPR